MTRRAKAFWFLLLCLTMGATIKLPFPIVRKTSAVVVPPTPAKPKFVTVSWVDASNRFELWHSTDLQTWTLLTNTPATVAITLPADKPKEFFKVRKIDPTTGAVSDWGTL